jgi:peptide/nickel transport system substrate-binding protein
VLFNQLSTLGIADPSVADQAKKPSGTGPYKFDSWVPRKTFQMSRYARHWDRRNPADIDVVLLQYILDEQARILNLQSGAVDMITRISFAAVNRLRTSSGLTAGATPAPIRLNITYCNCTRGALADSRVRKAIALSFDRLTWLKRFQYGQGSPTCFTPLAPTHWALYRAATTCAYDYRAGLAAAKQLLLMIPSGFPVDENRAVLYQDGLSQIGVESEILRLDPAAWGAKLFAIDYDISPEGQGWGGLSDPSIWYTYDSVDYNNGQGWSGYKNPRWTQLVTQGKQQMTRAQRKRTYGHLQQLTINDAPWWTESWEGLTWAAKSGVRRINNGYGVLGHMNYAKVTKA